MTRINRTRIRAIFQARENVTTFPSNLWSKGVARIIIIVLFFILMGLVGGVVSAEYSLFSHKSFIMPSTGTFAYANPPASPPTNESSPLDVPALEEFRKSLINGQSGQLVGVWAEGIIAYRVNSGLTRYAPRSKDTLSIYNWAWQRGVVGLIIHNYRGGTKLYQLAPGVPIAAIYGNGAIDWYVSRGGTWYESMDSASGGFHGPFRKWGCDDCEFNLSSRELHYRHYSGEHRLSFQTCVYVSGQEGLMIIEAYLANPPQEFMEVETHSIQFETMPTSRLVH